MMQKPKECIISTTQSSSNLPPLFYFWDKVKRSRKAAYSHYLEFRHDNYSNCPRKLKKRWKRKAERALLYQKGKVVTLSWLLLKAPVPNLFWEKDITEAGIRIANESPTIKFRRYSDE